MCFSGRIFLFSCTVSELKNEPAVIFKVEVKKVSDKTQPLESKTCPLKRESLQAILFHRKNSTGS